MIIESTSQRVLKHGNSSQVKSEFTKKYLKEIEYFEEVKRNASRKYSLPKTMSFLTIAMALSCFPLTALPIISTYIGKLAFVPLAWLLSEFFMMPMVINKKLNYKEKYTLGFWRQYCKNLLHTDLLKFFVAYLIEIPKAFLKNSVYIGKNIKQTLKDTTSTNKESFQ